MTRIGLVAREVRMNGYGQQALEHWRRFLPGRYAQIADPIGFFTELGEWVEQEVTRVQEQLALQSPPPPGLGYLERVGWENQIRASARELVLNEWVYLPPTATDPDPDPDIAPVEPGRAPVWAAGEALIDPGGLPVDRTHPLWADLEDESVSVEEFTRRAAAWRAQARSTSTDSTSTGSV